jgi:TRAP-type C4-dicarboxylate transport system substrate-binding protein
MKIQFLTRVGAVAALGFGSVIALSPDAAFSQTFDLKIGYATTNDPQHDLSIQLTKRLAERTGGRIKGRSFPASQLGKIPRQIEGLQLGTQEMFLTPPGFLVGLNLAFQVPDAPGLFDSHAHAQRAITWKPFRDKFVALAEAKGIVGGGVWIYDGTSIASVKPIRTLADIKGRKLRVLATKMESAMVGAFGAAGVPMPYTEVLPAMQRGTIDGVRSSIVVMGASKFFTVSKFITVINSGFIPSGIWISRVWLNRLPGDLRKIVLDTSRELESWAGKNAMAYGARAEDLWKKNRAEVIRFSPADQKQFMARVKPLGDKFLGANPRTSKMYALLKKAVAATR